MRKKKLNDLLRDVVAKIVEDELDLEGSPLVTIMGAEVSPTLEHAKILISVLPVERAPRVLKELARRIYGIQKIANRQLHMRPVPKLRFEIDTTEERATRIEKLLENVPQ